MIYSQPPPELHNLVVVLAIATVVVLIIEKMLRTRSLNVLRDAIVADRVIFLEGLASNFRVIRELTKGHLEQLLGRRRAAPPEDVEKHTMAFWVTGASTNNGKLRFELETLATSPCRGRVFWIRKQEEHADAREEDDKVTFPISAIKKSAMESSTLEEALAATLDSGSSEQVVLEKGEKSITVELQPPGIHSCVLVLADGAFLLELKPRDGKQSVKMSLYFKNGHVFDIFEPFGVVDPDCVVCLTDPKQVTLLPCRHFCVCAECYSHIDKCPVCRSGFESVLVIKGYADDDGDDEKIVGGDAV